MILCSAASSQPRSSKRKASLMKTLSLFQLKSPLLFTLRVRNHLG